MKEGSYLHLWETFLNWYCKELFSFEYIFMATIFSEKCSFSKLIFFVFSLLSMSILICRYLLKGSNLKVHKFWGSKINVKCIWIACKDDDFLRSSTENLSKLVFSPWEREKRKKKTQKKCNTGFCLHDKRHKEIEKGYHFVWVLSEEA